jgi:hypothetical protein
MCEPTNNDASYPCCRGGCQTAFDIASSIAREEDALACIIDAECAKIHRVLKTCNSVDDLIAIDTSVQATLEQVIKIEGILKAKLDSIIPILIKCI